MAPSFIGGGNWSTRI